MIKTGVAKYLPGCGPDEEPWTNLDLRRQAQESAVTMMREKHDDFPALQRRIMDVIKRRPWLAAVKGGLEHAYDIAKREAAGDEVFAQRLWVYGSQELICALGASMPAEQR
jgi:hypothetical protein